MQNLEKWLPTLFAEIYRMCFSASYDPGQESTWCWLTNEHIWDFSAPCFTKEQMQCPCMVRCEGHQLKMLLWILEEYIYILGMPVWQGQRWPCIVLGHKMLLLVCSHCCRNWGGCRGPCRASTLLMDNLPACFPETLECLTWALKDMVSLECLTWTMYDNILVLEPTPWLSGLESYGQIIRCLTEKAYKGLHVWCSAHTSAVFERVQDKYDPLSPSCRDLQNEWRQVKQALHIACHARERPQHVMGASLVCQVRSGNRRSKWFRPWKRHTEVDEGAPMLLHGGAFELLDIAAPAYGWWWNL